MVGNLSHELQTLKFLNFLGADRQISTINSMYAISFLLRLHPNTSDLLPLIGLGPKHGVILRTGQPLTDN